MNTTPDQTPALPGFAVSESPTRGGYRLHYTISTTGQTLNLLRNQDKDYLLAFTSELTDMNSGALAERLAREPFASMHPETKNRIIMDVAGIAYRRGQDADAAEKSVAEPAPEAQPETSSVLAEQRTALRAAFELVETEAHVARTSFIDGATHQTITQVIREQGAKAIRAEYFIVNILELMPLVKDDDDLIGVLREYERVLTNQLLGVQNSQLWTAAPPVSFVSGCKMAARAEFVMWLRTLRARLHAIANTAETEDLRKTYPLLDWVMRASLGELNGQLPVGAPDPTPTMKANLVWFMAYQALEDNQRFETVSEAFTTFNTLLITA